MSSTEDFFSKGVNVDTETPTLRTFANRVQDIKILAEEGAETTQHVVSQSSATIVPNKTLIGNEFESPNFLDGKQSKLD